MEQYRIAIVGCGSMGATNFFDSTLPFTYSFLGAVLENPRTKLVALIDTDAAKLDSVAQKLWEGNHARVFTINNTLAEAVAHHKEMGVPIDIVCCAAGPAMNTEVITNAKAWGIRGIYCEKPLSLSLAEADHLVHIEARDGLKINVNYLRNFDLCHLNIIKHIHNGGIGSLLCVRVLYKGGTLAVAPHAFALLSRLFERADAVSGVYSPLVNTRAPEDPNIDGTIRYYFAPEKRNVNVSLTATGRGKLDNNTYLFELEFTGTKGRISIEENGWRVRYEEMRPSRIFGSVGELMPYETASPLEIGSDAPPEFMINGLEDLLRNMDGNSSRTSCDAVHARNAEELAHALAQSARQTGLAVGIPLYDRKHAFARIVAGIESLRKEAGI